ncbi:hypothetical protein POM88_022054 [Heracleum sosnowskyi]|uniref:Uncharacterized protein n=1 Tax=Heracleum sosnowskyi TaxID=360622 RepID=A0AAD8MTC8_9APIA|nr:hypothetical protein POM88_022054 [Heracleum sosnowskyi]
MTIFDQLSSIDTSRTNWRIKVLVTRMWPSLSSSKDTQGGLKGYNMILLDDDNTHMHAFVYPENWKPIEKDMVEAEDDFMIPNHKFDFVDLSDLFALASGFENIESPEFSTDIIGVIEDFERVKPINTMFGEKNIVKFRITDGRYSHRVTVWESLL